MTLVPSHIETLKPYVPGKPIEEVQRELGLEEVVKLASNENPLGPSPLGLEAARRAVEEVHLYPDGASYYLKGRLAEFLGVEPAEIVIGNGSNEIIDYLIRTFLTPEDEAIVSPGSFIVYQLGCQAHGVPMKKVPLKERTFDLEAIAAAVSPRTKMIFVANPNNPTGTWVERRAFEAFLDAVPERVLIVWDEAYFEYVEEPEYPNALAYRARHPGLIVTRTFSKIYGLAGLRCGYAVLSAQLADYVDRVREPFNVNSVAQAAARAALDDTEHVARSRQVNAEGLAHLGRALPELGVRVTPSVANFVLADFDRPGTEIFEALLREGVIVRPMAGYGFPQSARITVGTPEMNARLIEALGRVLRR